MINVVDEHVPVGAELGVEHLGYHLAVGLLVSAVHLASGSARRDDACLVVGTHSRLFAHQLWLH